MSFSALDILATRIFNQVEKYIAKNTIRFYYGIWQGTESVDADLSQVLFDTVLITGVRKIVSVTGLSAGDTVLCVRGPATPMTIIGIVAGDITLM